MRLLRKPVFVLSVSSLALLGCMNPDGSYNKTNTGVGVGAAVGGLVGRALSDDDSKTRGTVLGAALGAAVGGAIGYDLTKQEQELRQSIGGSGAQIINTGDRLIVSLPEAITFPVDGTVVKSSLLGPLASLARNLNQYPNTIVQVVGHTDSTGGPAYNQNLSERRASAVAAQLTGNGVAYNRVQTIGMGERAPLASNATASGRQQNRRVEINIIPTKGY